MRRACSTLSRSRSAVSTVFPSNWVSFMSRTSSDTLARCSSFSFACTAKRPSISRTVFSRASSISSRFCHSSVLSRSTRLLMLRTSVTEPCTCSTNLAKACSPSEALRKFWTSMSAVSCTMASARSCFRSTSLSSASDCARNFSSSSRALRCSSLRSNSFSCSCACVMSNCLSRSRRSSFAWISLFLSMSNCSLLHWISMRSCSALHCSFASTRRCLQRSSQSSS
mmetsp:Transcript_18682/g.53561  ORF Transcript_18682/g.53561 Transcript_18682/m.53561 type:complete len:225 (+) Transcript_18682:878-1552(+)